MSSNFSNALSGLNANSLAIDTVSGNLSNMNTTGYMGNQVSFQDLLSGVTNATHVSVAGSVVAQAQAMGRPVVASDVGMLPEHVLVPPRKTEELRTGWVVAAADPIGLAHTLKLALQLGPTEYQAMADRARQFAEYMFSPQSAAAATRAVYMSLLAREL